MGEDLDTSWNHSGFAHLSLAFTILVPGVPIGCCFSKRKTCTFVPRKPLMVQLCTSSLLKYGVSNLLQECFSEVVPLESHLPSESIAKYRAWRSVSYAYNIMQMGNFELGFRYKQHEFYRILHPPWYPDSHFGFCLMIYIYVYIHFNHTGKNRPLTAWSNEWNFPR